MEWPSTQGSLGSTSVTGRGEEGRGGREEGERGWSGEGEEEGGREEEKGREGVGGRGGKEWKGRGGRELGERRGGEGGRRGGAQAEKDAQNRTESHFPAGASRGLKSGVPTHPAGKILLPLAFKVQRSPVKNNPLQINLKYEPRSQRL